MALTWEGPSSLRPTGRLHRWSRAMNNLMIIYHLCTSYAICWLVNVIFCLVCDNHKSGVFVYDCLFWPGVFVYYRDCGGMTSLLFSLCMILNLLLYCYYILLWHPKLCILKCWYKTRQLFFWQWVNFLIIKWIMYFGI